MDMQDRRVRRTQKSLARALIALTLEKGYEAITIRDITDRAEVGYATFFRHYHDKNALLQDVLDVVLDELTGLLQAPMDAANHIITGTLIFRYVQEHSEVVHVLLSSRGSASMVRRIIEAGTQSVFVQNTPLPDSPIPPEIAAYHLIASTISLIQWWVEHQMPYPPDTMGVIYQELIARPTQAAAFNHMILQYTQMNQMDGEILGSASTSIETEHLDRETQHRSDALPDSGEITSDMTAEDLPE